MMPEPRRFPPPWSVDDPDPQLERQCFIVRDHNGRALVYVHFEEGRRSAAHLLTRDEARAARKRATEKMTAGSLFRGARYLSTPIKHGHEA
jgi:hypothetical protein